MLISLSRRLSLTDSFCSPRVNANLLSRNEVVALINTLHRFSESLAAVNDFRRMWADADEKEAKQMIQEAQKSMESPFKVLFLIP